MEISALTQSQELQPEGSAHLQVHSDELQQIRHSLPGTREVGPLSDGEDAYTIRIVLSDSGSHIRAATYRFPKVSWEEWWSRTSSRLDESKVVPAAADASLVADDGGTGGSAAGVRLNTWPGESATSATTTTCYPDDTWLEGHLDMAPAAARSRHTAIWTGSQMIVWGGYGSDFLNTGARYDPLIDSWTAITQANAPDARYWHTAVWTGSRMVIWGGYNNSGYLNSGGFYDPASARWYPTTTANAPAPRYLHTAIWTGDRMIVWGGFGPTGALGTGGVYDPFLDTWTATSGSNAPSLRYLHSAVWT